MTVNKAEPIPLEEEELFFGVWSSWGHRFNDSIIIIHIILCIIIYLALCLLLLLVILILSVLFKKLVTSVQVTNKYSNLQQTKQISVFAATIN